MSPSGHYALPQLRLPVADSRSALVRRFVLREAGVQLSSVGLGGGWFRADDAAAGGPVLEASLEIGVNWVDTAEGYGGGDNESALGAALRSVPDMLVASKVSPWRSSLRLPEVHRACRDTLERLQRDVLD